MSFFEPDRASLTGNGWEALLAWMSRQRAESPVSFHQGAYHVFRAEAVRRVLSDSAEFSSDRTMLMPPMAQLGRGNLTMMDPPDHTRMRSIVNKAFTSAAVNGLAGMVDEIASGLVADLDPVGFDAVAQLAYPLPLLVIHQMLGLPDSARAHFSTWSSAFNRADVAAMDEMHRFLVDVARYKRRDPGDDVMSRLTGSDVAGQPPSDDEVASLAGLILLAGHVTTTSLIAAALFEAIERPALRPRAEDKMQIDALVEETLRVRPAFTQVTRIASGDQEIDGVPVPHGSVVAAWVLSANHDETLNPRPEEFLLDRENRRYLSFGHGVHFCLGSPLARMEARSAIRALLSRFPRLRRSGDVLFHPQPTLAVSRLRLSEVSDVG